MNHLQDISNTFLKELSHLQDPGRQTFAGPGFHWEGRHLQVLGFIGKADICRSWVSMGRQTFAGPGFHWEGRHLHWEGTLVLLGRQRTVRQRIGSNTRDCCNKQNKKIEIPFSASAEDQRASFSDH